MPEVVRGEWAAVQNREVQILGEVLLYDLFREAPFAYSSL